ncbi:UNVERIFIED_CONTAM: DnaJ domain-containing protein [Hammondia hammondi]|eukprot:XP_008888064.1 DnaJ domain-containing protein [Hammondia hammondi]
MDVAQRTGEGGPSGLSLGPSSSLASSKFCLFSPSHQLSRLPTSTSVQSFSQSGVPSAVLPSVFFRFATTFFTVSAVLLSLTSPLSLRLCGTCNTEGSSFLFAAAASESRRSTADECVPGSSNSSAKCAKKSAALLPPKKGVCYIASQPPSSCEVSHIRGLEHAKIPPVHGRPSFDAEDLVSLFFASDEPQKPRPNKSASRGTSRAGTEGAHVHPGGGAGQSCPHDGSASKAQGKSSYVDGDAEGETDEDLEEDARERLYFDPYEVLGIPADSSEECIRLAYRQKAKACHPDMVARRELRTQKNSNTSEEKKDPRKGTDDFAKIQEGGEETSELAASSPGSDESASASSGEAESDSEALSHAEKFMLIRSAFELLSNKQKREHFDRHGRSPDDPRFLHRGAVFREADELNFEGDGLFRRRRGAPASEDGDVGDSVDAIFDALLDFTNSLFDDEEATEKKGNSGKQTNGDSSSSAEEEYKADWSEPRRGRATSLPIDEDDSEVDLEEPEEEYEMDVDFRSMFDDILSESSGGESFSVDV